VATDLLFAVQAMRAGPTDADDSEISEKRFRLEQGLVTLDLRYTEI
jgi:hypothetical protein